MKLTPFILCLGLFVHGLVAYAGFSTISSNVLIDGYLATYKDDIMKGTNGGNVVYGDFILSSDEIVYNLKTNQIKLQGNILITGEGLHLKTTHIDYNFKTKLGSTGELKGHWLSESNPLPARSEVFEQHQDEQKTFYMTARSAELKTNAFDKPSFYLEKVNITDCDKDHPHHHVSFGKVIYSSNEKIELRHLVLRIFGLPYFYWPYGGKDLHYDWPWTRWEIGKEADWGQYGLFQTHLMPSTFNKHLKVGLGYRDRRGRSYQLHYERENENFHQDINVNLYDERWEDENGDLFFEDTRYQIDLYHKQKLSDTWNFRVDAHKTSSTEEFLWSGPNKIKSRDRYTAPAAGTRQLREGVIEEYDELTYHEGPLQEQEFALEYWKQNHYLQIHSSFGSDDEQVLQREKWIEFDGQMTPSPMFGEGVFYSNDYKFGEVGQRLGRDVSDADRLTVLGSNPIRDDFHITRGFLDQTLEAQVYHSKFLQLTPFVGSRSLFYEKVLKKGFEGQGFWETDETELDGWTHSHRIKSGLEIASRLTGDLGSGKYQHVIRPSLKFTYLSPTGLDMDQVVAPVDQIDLDKFGQYENLYSLDQELYVRRDGELQTLYLNRLSWRQILDSEDQTEVFGVEEREAEDLIMSQSFYPTKQLVFSLESALNTFHGQFPSLRAGVRYENDKFQASYHWNKLKDLTLLNSNLIVHRHDLNLLYRAEKDDFQLRTSWDEDPQQNLIISDSLYEHGFRNLEFIWGHMFHCLRSEVEISYDFEAGGSSVIFRFGPGIFNDTLPEGRFSL